MNYYKGIKQAIINNEITKKFKGYTQSRLRYMRRFYEVFSKRPSVTDVLTYTHYCEFGDIVAKINI